MLKIQFRNDVKGINPEESDDINELSHKRFLCKTVNKSDIPVLNKQHEQHGQHGQCSNDDEREKKLTFSNSNLDELLEYNYPLNNTGYGYKSKTRIT